MNHKQMMFWSTIRAKVHACADGRMMLRKWHLCYPGPACFGWAWVFPSGAVQWMGRTQTEVLEKLRKEATPWASDRTSGPS